MLKVLPLLARVFGDAFAASATRYQWSTLLVWLYVAEGVVRAADRPGAVGARWRGVEVVLALAFFAAIVAYLRLVAGSR